MSYCVNCGVELERSLKACPLCGVTVINPQEKEAPEAPPSFPTARDEFIKKDRTFWVGFFSLLYLVPVVTCVICNLLYDRSLNWAIFVTAGTLMLWTFTTSPFYFSRPCLRRMLAIDFLAVLFGLLIIQLMTGGKDWFTMIALPVTAYCAAASLILLTLTGKGRLSGFGLSGAITVVVGVLALLVELLTDLYAGGAVHLVWSWFVVAPCISIATLLVMISHNKRFRQELAKRLHV
jgi:hypothetical protein